MDGLLLDTERICDRTWTQAADQIGFTDVEFAKRACIGLNEADTRAFFENRYGSAFDYDQFRSLARKLTKEELEKQIPVKEGAEEILKFFKEKGLLLAVASSTREITVRAQLEKAGLLRYFDAVITGDMVTHGKPDPEIFIKACDVLHLPPETCLAFEDSLNGIRSAFRAKMYPVHVPDIQPEGQETIAMSWKKYDSLTEARKALENRFR